MTLDYIVSHIEGRVRVRHCALRDAACTAEFLKLFQGVKGLEDICINSRTGSALIHYDTAILKEKDLTKVLTQGQEIVVKCAPVIQEECEQSPLGNVLREPLAKLMAFLPSDTRARRRLLNRAMGSALALAVLGIGVESLHVFLASTFLLLAMNHVWVRRKAL